MKKNLLIFFLLISSASIHSQHVEYYHDYNGTIGGGRYVRAFVCDTTVDGNYLFVGESVANLGSSYVYAVAEKNGNVLWEKDSAVYDNMYNHEASFKNGRRTLDNGFVFCGTLWDFGITSGNGIFILKTDSAGNEVWRRSISRAKIGTANAIYLGSDSSLFFTGNVQDSNNIVYNNFLLKLSPQGDSLFIHEYSTISGSAESLFRIGDKFIIAGVTFRFDSLTQSNAKGFYFTSTDTLGNYLSTQTVFEASLSINPRNFWKMNDDKILVTCVISDTSSQGTVQVLKTDTSGTILWRDTIVNSVNVVGYGCELNDGNILVVYGNNQLQKLNSLGANIWSKDFADTSYHGFGYPSSSSVYPINNSTYLVSGGLSVSSPGGSWPTLTKIADTTLTLVKEIEKSTFLIYPNPASNSFTVKNVSSSISSTLQIINVLGSLVHEEQLSGQTEYAIDINFRPGIYFVRVNSGEMNAVKKLILK